MTFNYGRHALSISILILISVNSYALIGSQVNHEKNSAFNSACRIIVRDSDGTLASLCTGTLVSSKTVITASHCFEDLESSQKLEVACEFLGISGNGNIETTHAGGKVVTSGIDFKETKSDVAAILVDNGVSESARPSDFAEILFSTPFHLESNVRVADLTQSVKCYAHGELSVAGFGLNNSFIGGTFSSGIMKNDAVRTEAVERLFYDFNFPIAALQTEKWALIEDDFKLQWTEMVKSGSLPVAVVPGDSGGPIFCEDQLGTKYLIGVASGYALNIEENNPNRAYTGRGLTIWSEIRSQHLVPIADFVRAKGYSRLKQSIDLRN